MMKLITQPESEVCGSENMDTLLSIIAKCNLNWRGFAPRTSKDSRLQSNSELAMIVSSDDDTLI